jgi:hypothetical protein
VRQRSEKKKRRIKNLVPGKICAEVRSDFEIYGSVYILSRVVDSRMNLRAIDEFFDHNSRGVSNERAIAL